MTVKQLAQRLGVDIKELKFEFAKECAACKRTGGNNPPCKECTIVVQVTLREGT